MPKIVGLNHITIAVLNLAQSIAFYQNILGCALVANWDTGAYLLAGEIWLCLSYDPETRKNILPEYTHIAFNIAEKDFSLMANKLKKNNVRLWKDNKSEGESLYILDPDNYKLEIHSSNLKTRIAHMRKKPYPGMKLYEDIIKLL